jgi:hypothetical protein
VTVEKEAARDRALEDVFLDRYAQKRPASCIVGLSIEVKLVLAAHVVIRTGDASTR